MNIETFVGLRFLKPKRGQLLISAITMITIAGVAVGVAALIIVISVLTGFQEVVQSKHLEAFSHLIINSFQPYIKDKDQLIEKVASHSQVEAVSPFILGEVMLASESGVSGAVVRGVISDQVGEVTSLGDNMKIGSIDSMDSIHPSTYSATNNDTETPMEYPGILLGEELASQLHVVIGSEVRVISPLGEQTPMGVVPKMRRFVVSGIFSTGLYTFDAQFAFISLRQAQVFFNFPEDGVSGVECRLTDLWKARETGKEIVAGLGWPYKSISWMELNRNLFSAMKLEKVVMFIIVSLITMVAAFNIFSTIYMMVMDKQKSIAILKTMGADSARITRMFIMPGLIIALIGAFLGFCLGIGLCLLQLKFGLVKLDPQVYMFEQLPMKFKLFDFSLIAVAAFGFSLIATIIPAKIAAKLDPVKVLRYE